MLFSEDGKTGQTEIFFQFLPSNKSQISFKYFYLLYNESLSTQFSEKIAKNICRHIPFVKNEFVSGHLNALKRTAMI